MQQFRIGRVRIQRGWSTASPHFNLIPFFPQSSGQVGGGSSRLPYASVLPYVVLRPSTLNEQSSLRYVAYVDNKGLKAYQSGEFIHANIPLPTVSQLLSITFGRYAAMTHGIPVGSRCTLAQLKSCVEQHQCLSCPTYTTIFSVDKDFVKNSTACTGKFKKRNAVTKCEGLAEPSQIVFPLSLCSVESEHTI